MKGGARTRSGPPPDPNALRRDRDKAEWTRLPAAGRSGPAPTFPLPRPVKRELVLWEAEWQRPQAIMWEANGQEIEVAIYVRTLRQAETAKAHASVRTLLRQQMDSLGLTIPGLQRNRWVIGEAEPAAPERPVPTGPSARDRLKLVAGGSS